MVEFAMVAPVALMMILGLIAGSWLFWTNSSLSNGAKGGVRAASIMACPSCPGLSTPLADTSAGGPCSGAAGWGLGGETGTPYSIEQGVSLNADQITVAQQPLCVPPTTVPDNVPANPLDGFVTSAQPQHACGVAGPPGSINPIQLIQKNPTPGAADIIVDAKPGENFCDSSNTPNPSPPVAPPLPRHVLVIVVRPTQGFAPPFNHTYNLHGVSEMPLQQ